jgi:hypothetical protein
VTDSSGLSDSTTIGLPRYLAAIWDNPIQLRLLLQDIRNGLFILGSAAATDATIRTIEMRIAELNRQPQPQPLPAGQWGPLAVAIVILVSVLIRGAVDCKRRYRWCKDVDAPRWANLNEADEEAACWLRCIEEAGWNVRVRNRFNSAGCYQKSLSDYRNYCFREYLKCVGSGGTYGFAHTLGTRPPHPVPCLREFCGANPPDPKA